MRRSIGVLGVTCLALNAIVGSGIFALPDDLYRDLGALSPLAFALCAIGLLPVALCYAEAASGVERSGGPWLEKLAAVGRCSPSRCSTTGARAWALTINLFTFSKLAVLVVLTAALLPAAFAGTGTAARHRPRSAPCRSAWWVHCSAARCTAAPCSRC